MGVVAWFGALSVGGFVVLLLPHAPCCLVLLALLAPPLAAWLGL